MVQQHANIYKQREPVRVWEDDKTHHYCSGNNRAFCDGPEQKHDVSICSVIFPAGPLMIWALQQPRLGGAAETVVRLLDRLRA